MTTAPSMSVDVIVSQEKLNDFGYVQKKLFETKLNILFQICQSSDKVMSELVKEFLPEIQSYNNANALLEKYSLNIESLFAEQNIEEIPEQATEETSTTQTTKKILIKKKPDGTKSKTQQKNEVSPRKKIRIIKKK